MYIKILLGYLIGYVSVVIEGFFLERFINVCATKKIYLWNIKREKSTILHANIGIKDFREAVKIAKSTKCKIKITKKRGAPFKANKYKKRKVFIGCFFVLIISLIALSNFIWNIEIIGLEKIDSQEILNLIKQDGLQVGKIKQKIDVQEIINKIRLQRNDIAWVGIEIKGTNATIKIVEADSKPEIVAEDEYCNIVSTKDAMIVKVNALNGTPSVKEGDVVKKGTVLIKGWLEGNYTGIRYVHSEGEVIAKVWYSKKEKIYYNQVLENKTGSEEKKYTININNFKINLYKRLSNFENYDTMSTSNKLKISSDFYLPIEVIIQNNYEIEKNEVTYSKDEAKMIGVEKLEAELEQQIENKDDIANKYINTYENEEYIEVEVIYEVLENIGAKEKIVF